MNDHAVTEPLRLPRLNGHAAVRRFIVQEIVKAENVRSEQAITARVPIGRVPWILGMVQYGDAQLFAFNFSRIIHPVRTMSPDLPFAMSAFGIHHQSGPFG